jgi:DNA polymerase (family 10)
VQNTSEVVAALREIAALYAFGHAPSFKVKAYQRGAEVVATVGDLAPFVEQGRLGELAGIGPGLTRQIDELWNTGSSGLLLRLRAELPAGTSELVQVAGITPRRLRALHDALGVRSVAELRAACSAGRVRTLNGFGEKTEARLLAACDAWLTRGERERAPTLLSRALERAAVLEQELLKVVPEATLVGDARRGEETLRKLAWVVPGDPRPALTQLSRLRQVLRVEPDAPVAHLSEGLTLELHGSEAASLGNSLLTATGNDAHVAAVRALAAERGVSLATPFASEAELYAALGCAFVPPELRSGSDELAQAARGDFSDLLAVGDIMGMVHCHTTFSDGRNSVLEMATEAHALGMKYITITDHSPSASYAGGVTLDRLKAQWDEIAAAQERVPIRILRGTESDILADGSLDYPDSVLERFDVVIASIHARHHMDREAMTARISHALSLPLFKIWGHALGRILNHREPVACDVPRLLDALAASRGAIELNADPHRLDLPPAWIPAARERGIPFVVSVDAHSTRGFAALRYGVTMARRGGLRRSQVLNTASAEEFAARVRPV